MCRSDICERKRTEEIAAAAKLQAEVVQKTAEAQVYAEKQLLATVLEQLPMGVFILSSSPSHVGTSLTSTGVKLFNKKARAVWAVSDADSAADIDTHRVNQMIGLVLLSIMNYV